jgi:catechol 2,3-dioxygenase-like lactoylglutathione lyase family enzyme
MPNCPDLGMSNRWALVAGLLAGLVLVSLYLTPSLSQAQPKPSNIYTVGLVRIRVTNLEEAKHFYKDFLGLKEVPNHCFSQSATCLWINPSQRLELAQTTSSGDRDGLDRVGFLTDKIENVRRYVESRGVRPGIIQTEPGRQYFEIVGPEGHRIAFVSLRQREEVDFVFSPVSSSLIHAGFVVHDRAAEDKFYKDTLGFHVYWHGGMKEGEDNWVDMQVPDGTDWIEYMLKVPENATHKQLGVMNHIALGVPDIHAAQAQLIKNGWKGTEEPKIGRDGKWQLNLYDPDETRVELMEFKPTKEPCCSPYTGPHPGP